MELIEQVGKVEEVTPVEVITSKKDASKSWNKQSVVISFKDGNYEKFLAVEFFGKSQDELEKSGVALGDEAKVKFRVDSNQGSNGRYYTRASGAYIDVLSNDRVGESSTVNDDIDDMPF